MFCPSQVILLCVFQCLKPNGSLNIQDFKLLKQSITPMSRGPYKRYEYDPTVPIPKSTSYSKRKRGCEKEATENNTTYEDGINPVRTIFAILYS